MLKRWRRRWGWIDVGENRWGYMIVNEYEVSGGMEDPKIEWDCSKIGQKVDVSGWKWVGTEFTFTQLDLNRQVKDVLVNKSATH